MRRFEHLKEIIVAYANGKNNMFYPKEKDERVKELFRSEDDKLATFKRLSADKAKAIDANLSPQLYVRFLV